MIRLAVLDKVACIIILLLKIAPLAYKQSKWCVVCYPEVSRRTHESCRKEARPPREGDSSA